MPVRQYPGRNSSELDQAGPPEDWLSHQVLLPGYPVAEKQGGFGQKPRDEGPLNDAEFQGGCAKSRTWVFGCAHISTCGHNVRTMCAHPTLGVEGHVRIVRAN
eukprot:3798832-Rhodomonas_salina.1